MNKASPTLAHGFTLIEMTVVLLIMTLLAGVAIRETNSLSFQVRYEQTQERLERIREAILGNPRQIINGQQAVSGFVADMGRLPTCLRELIENYNCSTAGANAAWANAGAPSNLNAGWRGPYLNVPGNPTSPDAFTDGWGRMAQGYCSNISYTSQTACTTNGATWTLLANDNNYGWYYAISTNNLLLQSYGKDHVFGGPDYDADYPEPASQPAVKSQDWLVNISGGVNVNFIKSTEKLPPVSVCTDPTKTTKSACEPVGGIWHGGCSNAGYYNKSSCEPPLGSGTWTTCSAVGVFATRSACELAGGIWYGEGFGCSDQSKSNKALCTGTWRSCTDDGTITTENECLSADQIWYGNNIFSINTSSDLRICMKIFYRKSDSSIGVLISDEDISNDADTVNNDPKLIIADGSYQTIRFTNFRDSSSNSVITDIPIGTNAIGIYKHDGTTCTDTHYPADRRPIQVDFHPRTGLPVINW